MSGTRTLTPKSRVAAAAARQKDRHPLDDIRAALAVGAASGPASPARSAAVVKAAGRARLAASNGA